MDRQEGIPGRQERDREKATPTELQEGIQDQERAEESGQRPLQGPRKEPELLRLKCYL